MASQSALVLPPGVAPPSRPPAVSGPAFDREFFQQVLPAAVKAYCDQVSCTVPMVELHTADGSRFFVRGISAVTDAWVALHTHDESTDDPIQVFVPYATILRVEVHSDLNPEQRRLGFLTGDGDDDDEEAVESGHSAAALGAGE